MRSEAWRPAAAARNRSPREAGTPPSRHYDLGARSSLHGSGWHLPAVVGRRAPKETEARPREPKIATVERREASVPRHGKCSLHSTPYDSTAVWIIPRSIVLLQHSAVLRSMVLHSYIPDTDRTLAFAQTTQCQARKCHGPPQARAAEEALLRPALARHRARLPPQRRGRHMDGAGGRRRCRVD